MVKFSKFIISYNSECNLNFSINDENPNFDIFEGKQPKM